MTRVEIIIDRSRYWRSQDGETVHRETCRYAATGQPWTWTNGRRDVDVAAHVYGASWMRACRWCDPFAGIAPKEIVRRLAEIVGLTVEEE